MTGDRNDRGRRKTHVKDGRKRQREIAVTQEGGRKSKTQMNVRQE